MLRNETMTPVKSAGISAGQTDIAHCWLEIEELSRPGLWRSNRTGKVPLKENLENKYPWENLHIFKAEFFVVGKQGGRRFLFSCSAFLPSHPSSSTSPLSSLCFIFKTHTTIDGLTIYFILKNLKLLTL